MKRISYLGADFSVSKFFQSRFRPVIILGVIVDHVDVVLGDSEGSEGTLTLGSFQGIVDEHGRLGQVHLGFIDIFIAVWKEENTWKETKLFKKERVKISELRELVYQPTWR